MFWRRARYHLPIESELKRHSGRAVAYFLLLAVLLGFYAFAIGCSSERSPTAAPVILATPTPAPVATPAPVVAATPAPSGKHDWWFRADGSFCVTNHSGNVTSFQACARKVYPGGDQDFTSTDAIVPGGWIPDGDTFCGKLPLFGCYTEMELLEQPNTCNDFKQITGARYLNVGQYCARATPAPTPTPGTPTPRTVPTPSPTPTPIPSPTPAPSPTPCPAAHFTGEAVVATAGTFSAIAQATGAGSWKLSIYATSDLAEYQANQPDYVKDTDAATTTCETAATLSVSYGWQGHPSRYWWGDLKLNGSRIWKSAVVEHAP